MQLKIHKQNSLDRTLYIYIFLYLPNDLDKTFHLPNKNVLKYRKYVHWYHGNAGLKMKVLNVCEEDI